MSSKVFTIVKNKLFGRYLIATRDISPGEIIIEESPIILGPSFSNSANHEDFVCLSCNTRIRSSALFKCNLCTLNSFCSDKCTESESHLQYECRIFQKSSSSKKFNNSANSIHDLLSNLQNPSSRKLLYATVILIRGLYCLKLGSKWAQIEEFESKAEAFEKIHAFDEIDPIINELTWDDFEMSEMISDMDLRQFSHHVIGAMRNNAFSHFSSKMSYEGLYFLSSFMAHSCVLNTDRQFDEDGTMTVKAATKISLGQPITTTYISLLGNSNERRRELETNWLFVCNCQRCGDSTDFSTFLGSVRCPGCEEFTLIPHDWTCVDKKCYYSQQGLERDLQEDISTISRFIKEVEESKPGVGEIEQMENWLLKYDDERFLPRTHSIFLQIKAYLCQVYGKDENIETISLDKLKRKLEFSSLVLKVLEIILPIDGIFQFKGRILFEIWSSLRELVNRKEERESNLQFSPLLFQQVPEIPFEEAIEEIGTKALMILSYAIPGSNDASMAKILKECY